LSIFDGRRLGRAAQPRKEGFEIFGQRKVDLAVDGVPPSGADMTS